MSFWSWLGKYTVGGYWNKFDKVDPWTLEEIEQQQRKDIARAKGVGVGGKTVVASVEDVKRAQDASVKEINNYLRSQNQHPDQLDLPSALRNMISGDVWPTVMKVVVILGVVYVGVELGKAFISRR